MIILASANNTAVHQGKVWSTTVSPNLKLPEAKVCLPQLHHLAPSWEIVTAHKSQKITDQQYIYGYEKRYHDKMIQVDGYRTLLQQRWPSVETWLLELKPEEDLTLCCFCPQYEKNGHQKFCHRQYLAKMLAKFRPDIKRKLY